MLIKFLTKRKLILFAFICYIGFICGSDNHQTVPVAPGDLKHTEKAGTYWELTAPEEQGIDSQNLLEMLQTVKKEKYNTHSIIIVTTGSNIGAALHLVFNFIIPSVKSSQPLPANPKAVDALRQICRQLQSPSTADAEPIAPHPKIIKDINGKTYSIEPNNMGLFEMTFHFSDKAYYLSVVHERGTFERMEVGLDNVYRVSEAGPWGEWPIHDKTALRGKWKNSNTFFLDLHPVGRGVNPLMDIRFKEKGIDISVVLTGTYTKFQLKGKMKNIPPNL